MIKIECDHKTQMSKVHVDGSTADIMVDGILTCLSFVDMVRTNFPAQLPKFLEVLQRDLLENPFYARVTIDTSKLGR